MCGHIYDARVCFSLKETTHRFIYANALSIHGRWFKICNFYKAAIYSLKVFSTEFLFPAMRYFEVTAADTSVMSQICDHGEKFVQPMHPHFSRPCT